ncbi:hypothetical protein pb186bvf_000294 [Paramecium bursaria]
MFEITILKAAFYDRVITVPIRQWITDLNYTKLDQIPQSAYTFLITSNGTDELLCLGILLQDNFKGLWKLGQNKKNFDISRLSEYQQNYPQVTASDLQGDPYIIMSHDLDDSLATSGDSYQTIESFLSAYGVSLDFISSYIAEDSPYVSQFPQYFLKAPSYIKKPFYGRYNQDGFVRGVDRYGMSIPFTVQYNYWNPNTITFLVSELMKIASHNPKNIFCHNVVMLYNTYYKMMFSEELAASGYPEPTDQIWSILVTKFKQQSSVKLIAEDFHNIYAELIMFDKVLRMSKEQEYYQYNNTDYFNPDVYYINSYPTPQIYGPDQYEETYAINYQPPAFKKLTLDMLTTVPYYFAISYFHYKGYVNQQPINIARNVVTTITTPNFYQLFKRGDLRNNGFVGILSVSGTDSKAVAGINYSAYGTNLTIIFSLGPKPQASFNLVDVNCTKTSMTNQINQQTLTVLSSIRTSGLPMTIDYAQSYYIISHYLILLFCFSYLVQFYKVKLQQSNSKQRLFSSEIHNNKIAKQDQYQQLDLQNNLKKTLFQNVPSFMQVQNNKIVSLQKIKYKKNQLNQWLIMLLS